MKKLFATLLLASSLCLAGGGYRPRPVVTIDHDDQNIPEPAKREDSLKAEFIANTFFGQTQKVFDVRRTIRRHTGDYRARNVNVMDDVPGSTWFSNRINAGTITPERLERGAAVDPAPAFQGSVRITDGKKGGITPGFVVKDAAGVTWFLKLDPADYPEMMTAAEVISSRLMWGAGYNVPQEWIAHLRREQLRIDPKATVLVDGRVAPMNEAYLDELLSRVARRPDGSYRVVASRKLPGKLKGGFRFRGTREDDANDLIPHEHRRDVRGLRVLCAWINHEDIKAGNTVSSYVEENGRHFLRHYLWDFGSSLGSDGFQPNIVRAGHANVFDLRLIGERIVTAGLWQPRWKKHPTPIVYASVGRLGDENFQPGKWKPTIPNRAFDNMMDSDAFWAAKIVGSFTDDHIRAAVRAGQLTDPEAAAYLVKTLAQRRDVIMRHWFLRMTPVQEFRTGPVRGGQQEIEFTDLAVSRGLVPEQSYTYQFFLTNTKGDERALTPVRRLDGRQRLVVPREVFAQVEQAVAQAAGEADQRVVHVELRAGKANHVRAYFIYEGRDKGLRWVGIEHQDKS